MWPPAAPCPSYPTPALGWGHPPYREGPRPIAGPKPARLPQRKTQPGQAATAPSAPTSRGGSCPRTAPARGSPPVGGLRRGSGCPQAGKAQGICSLPTGCHGAYAALARDSLLWAAEPGLKRAFFFNPPTCRLHGRTSDRGWGGGRRSQMGCRQLLSANWSQAEVSRTLMENGQS